MLFSTVAERAQRAATSENMQIEKAPTNQKNISLNTCSDAHNALICSAFLSLVVLWVFAARVLSNWWRYFLNLHVFFLLIAACWALLATVVKLIFSRFVCVTSVAVCCEVKGLYRMACWEITGYLINSISGLPTRILMNGHPLSH